MKLSLFVFIILYFFCFDTYYSQEKDKKELLSTETIAGLKLRCIGPAFTSGRISDFAVNPRKTNEYYAAVSSGGVWKTVNAGTTWEPVFENEGSYSVGCVTIDPNNPFIVWIGTGENNSQRSVGYGDGIYKSYDGGKNWKHMGLKNSEHIAEIIIDPRNSNVVYVASQGPLWGPGGDRGLFKSTNGGETWENVLEVSENTGITDLVFDPRNPDVLYAASYQRRRHVWTLINGGPESAIYKSEDAGKTWKKLETGLPKGDVGRIGLAISPVNPDVLYAIIEAQENKGGFFISVNRGASWEKRNEMISRSPQYYQEIICDPLDVDKVYSLDTWTMITEDGGKTFNRLGNKHRHVDDHALWIDPENTDHLLIGGDGGIYESYDGGNIWDFKNNLPITQFYKVATDNSEPFYYVYGGTQDNNSMGGPSQTLAEVGIVNADWFITQGGDGYESQIDPVDPNIVYAQYQYGGLTRYNKETGESIDIQPKEGKGEEPYRWNWDTPLLLSPHKHTRLYFPANYLFKSDDMGNSWEKISGDLTRQIDRDKLEVMGKIWSVDAVAKNKSTSYYGNVVALSESPIKEGLIYTGSDDGLINVTNDGGKNWTRIEKFTGVPERTYVNMIIASLHEVDRVYAAFNNHKNSDFKPYLLKSDDAGKTWKSIAGNLPERGSVYSIAEDHVNPDLLFAGTEFGIFFTIDGGKKWIQLKGNMPTIAVRDIDIQRRENDLVLATFGRGFYILDNYTPLRSLSKEILENENHIFPVKDVMQYIQKRQFGGSGKSSQGEAYYAAENPPFGATITYYLKDDIKTKKELRREKEKELINNNKPVPFPSIEDLRAEDDEPNPYLLFIIKDIDGNVVRRLKADAKKGINRITWDLRYASLDPENLKDDDDSGTLTMPGKYSVSMAKIVNGIFTELPGSQTFNTVLLNSKYLNKEELAKLISFNEKFGELYRSVEGTIKYFNDVKNKIKYLKSVFKNTPGAEVEMLSKINDVENSILNLDRKLNGDKTLSSRDINQGLSIADRVESVVYDLMRTTSVPSKVQTDNYDIASQEYSDFLSQLNKVVNVDIISLESALEQAGAPWTPGRFPQFNKK